MKITTPLQPIGLACLLIALALVAGCSRMESLKMSARTAQTMQAARARLEALEQNSPGYRAWGSPRVMLAVAAGLASHEGFSIKDGPRGEIIITGGGVAGLEYGLMELGELFSRFPARPPRLDIEQTPDFEVRGTTLFLMKNGSYDYSLTPEQFPWFYDRELILRYLDYLHANRFNTIFLWTGHLFPSIVELPDYPDATDLSPEQLRRNQEQFRWLTDQCARRNISVLLHFYNIHISKPLAASRKIPLHYNKPDAFAARYLRDCLDRFFSKFADVGLYVCPGEMLWPQYQPEWFEQVIFPAAKAAPNHPRVVVRAWMMDRQRMQDVCRSSYDNTYTELKHNCEMILSTEHDPAHGGWLGVARRHIVNLHEMGDIKPFRWGSPLYIREMVDRWRAGGIQGAEIYGMASWRWPYALDKLSPEQQGYWPEGPKLLTFERDWIWLEAFGRYLWKVDRPAQDERAYWCERLTQRFGPQAAPLTLEWYHLTAPILPNLQNLTAVHNMNWHPTAVAREQMADRILAARWEGGQWDYPSMPVDPFFFERYKARFACPGLTDRISMPLATLAQLLADGKPIPTDMITPDRASLLLVEMAQEALELAQRMEREATTDREELARFISDSQALVYIARIYQHQIQAALGKRLLQLTGQAEYEHQLLDNEKASLETYRHLAALTGRTYLAATDLHLFWFDVNWPQGLAAYEKELAQQTQAVALMRWERQARADKELHWIMTTDMQGDWRVGRDVTGFLGMGFRHMDFADKPTTSQLTTTLTLPTAARYTVWVHAAQGPGESRRDFSVKIGAQTLPPTHQDAPPGPEGIQFGWQRAGVVDLTAGTHAVDLIDTNTGPQCVDAVVLTANAEWSPPTDLEVTALPLKYFSLPTD